MLARFKHDMDAFGEVRKLPKGQNATPETVPIQTGTINESGKLIVAGKDDIWLPGKWKDYLHAINPPGGGDWALEPKAGWLNTNQQADTLGFGGNLVEVLRVLGPYAQVKCFDVNGKPPNPRAINYLSGDARIQKWTVVARRGNIINPGNNSRDIYSFLISKTDMWIHVSRLEFFPTLPKQVKVRWLAWRGLYVRSTPERKSNNVIGVVGPFSFSQPVTLLQYAPRGSSVWAKARLRNGKEGYLPVLWYPSPGPIKYYTSWKMLTAPPIAPKAIDQQSKRSQSVAGAKT